MHRDTIKFIIEILKGQLIAASCQREPKISETLKSCKETLDELDKLVKESDYLPCVSSRFMIFKVPEFYPSGGISDCVGRYETLEAAKEAFKEKGYYEDCYIYDRFKDKVVYDPEEDE